MLNYADKNINYYYRTQGNNNFKINPNIILVLLLLVLSFGIGIGMYLMIYTINNSTNQNSSSKVSDDLREGNVLGIKSTNLNKCYNRVVYDGQNYYWIDGCNGDPDLTMCFTNPSQLTQNELNEYFYWVNQLNRNESYLNSKCIIPNPSTN